MRQRNGFLDLDCFLYSIVLKIKYVKNTSPSVRTFLSTCVPLVCRYWSAYAVHNWYIDATVTLQIVYETYGASQ